jgi:hypothetical protein
MSHLRWMELELRQKNDFRTRLYKKIQFAYGTFKSNKRTKWKMENVKAIIINLYNT